MSFYGWKRVAVKGQRLGQKDSEIHVHVCQMIVSLKSIDYIKVDDRFMFCPAGLLPNIILMSAIYDRFGSHGLVSYVCTFWEIL